MHITTELPGVVVGQLAGLDAAGGPLVRWNDGEKTSASVIWMPVEPDWAACEGTRVVLGFVEGDPSRPIILGLLDAPRATPRREPEVLRIASGRELVIECGQARIALRADGRVEIRGTHLVSRSSGPNKIKGGTVHIN